MTTAALTHSEFDALKAFIDANSEEWPEAIRALFDRLVTLYEKLAGDKKKAADVLKTLRMAMGIDPTSERGKQLLSKR